MAAEWRPFQSVEKPGLCVKHKPGFCRIEAKEGNRQRSKRIDFHEIIVLERSGTFQHYFVRGVLP